MLKYQLFLYYSTIFCDTSFYLEVIKGSSLAVQWFGLRDSTAGGMGLSPSWGNKIPHAAWSS